jgi:hypothetical protein
MRRAEAVGRMEIDANNEQVLEAAARPKPRGVRQRGTASTPPAHVWGFRARLRRRAFGWRSSRLAVTRINEALREIRKAAKTDAALAAAGAVLLLERVSPAFEQVDSSSGALGGAVNRAIEELSKVIAAAPVDEVTRVRWLERLWQACADDGMCYLDTMEELWGDLCATPEVAARWADENAPLVRSHWQRPRGERGYLKGSVACLSAMLKAQRYHEILDLLSLDEATSFWPYREWGFRALVAQGRRAEALRYAEATNDINSEHQIARACEDLLLSSGMADEAYERYAHRALREEMTYVGTFRSMLKRYPHKGPETILRDLAARTPGGEGKWFAAAKDAGLYDVATRLANTSPCDPMTLARAARDFGETLPEFAVEASAASLRWMAEGYGYELAVIDVIAAYSAGLRAAERLDRAQDFTERIKALVVGTNPFVRDALRHHLELPATLPTRRPPR